MGSTSLVKYKDDYSNVQLYYPIKFLREGCLKMAMPSGSELLLIFGIVVLLFGAKKIPDLAKSIGQGIRGFKKEMKDEDTAPPPTADVTPEPPKQVENVTTVNAEPVQETTKQA